MMAGIKQSIKKGGIKPGEDFGLAGGGLTLGLIGKDHDRGRFLAVVCLHHETAGNGVEGDVVLLKSDLARLEVDAHQFAGEATGLGEE